AFRAARLPRRGLPADALPLRRVARPEGDRGCPRRVLGDRRRRDRVRVPVPGLRQRRDDDRDRAGDGHPPADGQRRRLVDGREPRRDRRPAGDPRPRPRSRTPRPLVIKAKPSKLPIKPGAVLGLLKELRASAQADKPLVVSGARELVAVLVRELARGGVASAVREQGPLDGAAALVHVLAGPVDDDDEELLKQAAKERIPIVVVTAGPTDPGHVSYVLDRDIVRVGAAAALPVDEIATRLARTLGEAGTPLAARLPVLRRAVCEELIRRFSRQNGLVGVAVFVPGADLPVLTLNQVRLVLRIADAYGFEIDRNRLPEVLSVVGSGFGFRALARSAVGYVPLLGWAVKGAVAYTCTRALGEAAMRYFERRAPVTRVAGARTLFPR